MAVTYGFFNSVNGDRKYNAEQMSEYFRGIINEGVYQHLDGGLAVTAGTGLAVNVAAGRAIIQNRWVQNSAAMSLTIAAASETYARKDAVVIRLNWSSRSISIAVKTGTPAASPVAPSMTRNSTTYEMALAYVNVAANATSVTVTDKRADTTVCGWATVAESVPGEIDAQLNAMKTGFDGVVYPTPAAMVQGEDQKLMNEITKIEAVNFMTTTTSPVNLIKRPYMIPNQYINTEGSVRDSEAFWRTDFIPVEGSATYRSANVGLSAWYDASKTFISYVANLTTATTAPASAAYIRCSIPTASVSVCVLVKGDTIPSPSDNGFINFEDAFTKKHDALTGVFAWYKFNIIVDYDAYSITFPATTVFQSYISGKYFMIQASAKKTYTLNDGQCIILKSDFQTNQTVNSFDDAMEVVNITTVKNNIVVFARNSRYIISQVDNLLPEIANDVFFWTNVTVDNSAKTITFPARTVMQSYSTGAYLLINAATDKTYTIADAKKLICKDSFTSNVTTSDFDSVFEVISNGGVTSNVVIASNITGVLHSDLIQVHEAINKRGTGNDMPEPPKTDQRISEAAPDAFTLMKNKTTDMNIVVVGDSISTALGYEASARSDAKYRPPLMTEYTYPSYIEEQLRWNGQVYNRFDVSGVFTEVCTSAETLTEDTEHWDWPSNNNRPAITRCLSGNNCSVSYAFDPDYKRQDYIYRTDCTNPATTTVSISAGNGKVVVYDEATDAWVEANGYTFSAQESDQPIVTSFGNLMKSMYQKRLKMKWAGASVSGCTVTIQNNGSGRLTYWGIQKGKKEVMMNFINSARGGHSTMRLKPFEEWDVDYWAPQLILWEVPYFNHGGVDICVADYVPKTNVKTVSAMVSDFTTYVTALKNKEYSPEIISWSVWLASQNAVHAIDQKGAWLHAVDTAGNYVSTRDYVNGIEMMIRGLDIPFIDFMSMFRMYGFEYAAWRDISDYETATTIASGITGETWTVDGGHLNNRGALILKKMFGSFFLQ